MATGRAKPLVLAETVARWLCPKCHMPRVSLTPTSSLCTPPSFIPLHTPSYPCSESEPPKQPRIQPGIRPQRDSSAQLHQTEQNKNCERERERDTHRDRERARGKGERRKKRSVQMSEYIRFSCLCFSSEVIIFISQQNIQNTPYFFLSYLRTLQALSHHSATVWGKDRLCVASEDQNSRTDKNILINKCMTLQYHFLNTSRVV